jgi:hypothetical protein
MGTNNRDQFVPNVEEPVGVVRAAIDEICRQEPEEAVVARVVGRAVNIPSLHVCADRARTGNCLIAWTEKLTMKQRIALGSVGATAALGLLLVWAIGITRPASAMEKMVQSIRKAKSYKYTATHRITAWDDHDSFMVEETVYWLAPGSRRIEGKDLEKKDPKPWMESIAIEPAGKPGIVIYPHDKCFWFQPARHDNFHSPFDEPENFADLSAQAEMTRALRVIDGKKARGFVIDVKKIDPDFPCLGFEEIWIDVDTSLPVMVHSRLMRRDFVSDRVMHYQWNIELSPDLFATKPPKGYKDDTEPPISSEERVRRITEALRIYAELNRGRYPQARYVSSAVLHDLVTLLGFDDPPTKKQFHDSRFSAARAGLRQIWEIERFRPDVAYYGRTVGPNDKNNVLLRWKLDDSRYQVIFGDLHAETVTLERLHELEGGQKGVRNRY